MHWTRGRPGPDGVGLFHAYRPRQAGGPSGGHEFAVPTSGRAATIRPIAVSALDVALAGVAGTLLAPIVGGWIERGATRRRHQLDRQLARDNLNFAEKKAVYADVLVHAQCLSTSARRLHHWTEVGGEAPELLELPGDEEQALLAGRLATFASEEVTARTQVYWNAFFAYLDTGPVLVQARSEHRPDEEIATLRLDEADALDALHRAGVTLRDAVRADLAEP